MGQTACPVVSGTPRVVYSAFIKEQDWFAKNGLEYIDDTVTFTNLELLAQALKAQNSYEKMVQQKGKEILESAFKNKEVVILLLGRPYHLDPGINHEILTEFQNLGFKVITINSIPKEVQFLEPFFKDDFEKRLIESVFDIRDVWEENFSTNSAQKVWAAKFDGGKMKDLGDVNIVIPSNNTPRIQEMHIMCGHMISAVIDSEF